MQTKTRMRYLTAILILFFTAVSFPKVSAQSDDNNHKIRQMTDTVGFAGRQEQMDAIMKYIDENENENIENARREAGVENSTVWKTAICPHDDYTYAGYLYPALLQNIRAKTIILIGVCHRAKQFNLENKIIFGSFEYWKMPYGKVKVSGLRDEIIRRLEREIYIIHDSVQQAEHSVEAVIPFLQYYNRDIEIISILVPYMPFDRMNVISGGLSEAIYEVMSGNNLQWGKDFALIISNDAVHYGDEDWGGKNFALYGTDSAGYSQAVNHEYEIINNCLTGTILPDNIRTFTEYTVKEEDYRDYKWTWCGRYSIPLGLMTAYYLQKLTGDELNGVLLKYATSIDHPHIPVKEIGMGVTAPANSRHWVGYAAIGYR